MPIRKVDITDTEVRVFADEIKTAQDYEYFRKLAESVNKDIRFLSRPPAPPENAMVVNKAELRTPEAYFAAKKKAESKRKRLWIDESDIDE